VAKNRQGQSLKSTVETLDAPHQNAGCLMAPPGTLDDGLVTTDAGQGVGHAGPPHEVKAWQAIMDHLSRLAGEEPGRTARDPDGGARYRSAGRPSGVICPTGSRSGRVISRLGQRAAHPDRQPRRPDGAKPLPRLTPTGWRDWTKVQSDAGAPRRSLHALWERLPIEGDALIAAARRETDLKPTQNG
jgi:hypothetical protein